MKIARFSHEQTIAFGIIDDDEVVVLKGDPMFAGYDPTDVRLPLRDVKLLAPVIPRSKVVGMAYSFFASAEEKDAAAAREPRFFLKPNTAVVGPGDPIVLPARSADVRVEGELAVVIGKIAKNVTLDAVADVIFGYTIANDVIARDLYERDGELSAAKSFDSFCPLGPVIDTEFDLATLAIRGRINEHPLPEGDVSLLRHGILEMVAFVSGVFTLLPGDVVLTGAPAVSVAVTDGDTVRIEIPGIGVLSNPVRRA